MGFLNILSKFIPGVTDIASGVIGAKAATGAAQAQQDAVNQGINTINGSSKVAQDSITSGTRSAQDIGRQFYDGTQYYNAPYMESGQYAAKELEGLTGAGGELDNYRPENFNPNAPTFKFDPSQVQVDPGFQFRLDQGNKALLAARAAHGTLGSGATDKALMRYDQDLGSQEYAAAHDRAYQSQSDAFKSEQQKYADSEQAFRDNQAAVEKNQQARFDRLATRQQLGQSAAADTNSAGKAFGTQAAGFEDAGGQNIAGIQTNAARDVTDLLTQGGNAKASGIIGKANATTGALGNAGDQFTVAALNRRYQQQNNPVLSH